MVHLESRLDPPPFSADVIKRAANQTLVHQATAGDLTIVLTDAEQLQELNRLYLGTDSSTDVLAFPAAEPDPDSGLTYLGDVLISIPQAEAQARSAGHALASEVQLLVVHGVLHLLGHDHVQPEARATMWAVQTDVLKSIGLSDIVIRE
jgi:probable rRNA maturation factor